MPLRTMRLTMIIFAAFVLRADCAWAIGEILGQTKEELKLKYDVTVHDPGTGRVIIEFTLADEGRLKPVDVIELMIPAADGSGSVDLSLAMATRQVNGKRQARVELKKEWAARAEIWLTTYSFDGKQLAMTRYHHVIPVAKYMKNAQAAEPK